MTRIKQNAEIFLVTRPLISWKFISVEKLLRKSTLESKSEYIVENNTYHLAIFQKCICFCWCYLQSKFMPELIFTSSNQDPTISHTRENSKRLNINLKCFSFFNNIPPASWVAHITKDFITCYSCSWNSSHKAFMQSFIWIFQTFY